MASGFVGIVTFDLHFPEVGSLKGKRRHLQHAKAQLERRFGASVAEVDFHELWQRSRLTMVLVRRDASQATRALADAERYLYGQEFELVRADRCVLSVEEDL